jgi:ComF family protein
VFIRGWFRQLLDFCYPGTCAACERPCEGGFPACESCLSKLEQLETASACNRCARPVAGSGAWCPWCVGKGIYPFEQIVNLGMYKEPLRRLIHRMKYNGRWPLAEQLAHRLWEQQKVRNLLESAEVIIPVPLHRWKQIARGYNQSQVIACWLGKKSRKLMARPIVRLRATISQTQLRSHQKRIENLQDAFGLIDESSVRGKHVVVVDDVMTTGATLQEIGRTLLQAQPSRLSAIVLAVSDPKRKDFESI